MLHLKLYGIGLAAATKLMKTKGFDLQHAWTLWVDLNPHAVGHVNECQKHKVKVGGFSTIPGFWRYNNNLLEKLPRTASLCLFKSHIEPSPEEPLNCHGGQTVAEVSREDERTAWLGIAMALVGESLEASDYVCGIVLSRWAGKSVFSLWSSTCHAGITKQLLQHMATLLKVHAKDLSFTKHVLVKKGRVLCQAQAAEAESSAKVEEKQSEANPWLNRSRTERLRSGGTSPHTSGTENEEKEEKPKRASRVSAGTAPLLYTADFLRLFSISASCLKLPAGLDEIDWETLGADAELCERQRKRQRQQTCPNPPCPHITPKEENQEPVSQALKKSSSADTVVGSKRKSPEKQPAPDAGARNRTVSVEKPPHSKLRCVPTRMVSLKRPHSAHARLGVETASSRLISSDRLSELRGELASCSEEKEKAVEDGEGEGAEAVGLWPPLHEEEMPPRHTVHRRAKSGQMIIIQHPPFNPNTAHKRGNSSGGGGSGSRNRHLDAPSRKHRRSHSGPRTLYMNQRRVSKGDLARIMAPYLEFFDVDIVERLTPAMQIALLSAGCPMCLRRHTLVMGAPMSATPTVSAAAEKTYDASSFVVLKCREMDCIHPMHMPCLSSIVANPRPDTPVLERFHTSCFFHVSPSSTLPLHVPRDELGSRRYCTIEVGISHILSNAQVMHCVWPQIVSSLANSKTGEEYLLLRFDQVLAKGPNPPPQAPKFSMRRGRFLFKCVNRASLERWTHDCNFSVSLRELFPRHSVRELACARFLRLLMVDPATHRRLLLGVRLVVKRSRRNEHRRIVNALLHPPTLSKEHPRIPSKDSSDGCPIGQAGRGVLLVSPRKFLKGKVSVPLTPSTCSRRSDSLSSPHLSPEMTDGQDQTDFSLDNSSLSNTSSEQQTESPLGHWEKGSLGAFMQLLEQLDECYMYVLVFVKFELSHHYAPPPALTKPAQPASLASIPLHAKQRLPLLPPQKEFFQTSVPSSPYAYGVTRPYSPFTAISVPVSPYAVSPYGSPWGSVHTSVHTSPHNTEEHMTFEEALALPATVHVPVAPVMAVVTPLRAMVEQPQEREPSTAQRTLVMAEGGVEVADAVAEEVPIAAEQSKVEIVEESKEAVVEEEVPIEENKEEVVHEEVRPVPLSVVEEPPKAEPVPIEALPEPEPVVSTREPERARSEPKGALREPKIAKVLTPRVQPEPEPEPVQEVQSEPEPRTTGQITPLRVDVSEAAPTCDKTQSWPLPGESQHATPARTPLKSFSQPRAASVSARAHSVDWGEIGDHSQEPPFPSAVLTPHAWRRRELRPMKEVQELQADMGGAMLAASSSPSSTWAHTRSWGQPARKLSDTTVKTRHEQMQQWSYEPAPTRFPQDRMARPQYAAPAVTPAPLGWRGSNSSSASGRRGATFAQNLQSPPSSSGEFAFGRDVNLGAIVAMNALQDSTPTEIKGRVVSLALTHDGSRFLQQKLERQDPQFCVLILQEMLQHLPLLCTDSFGHFAIEKLLSICNDAEILTFIQKLAPDLCDVSCQKHGSFSVQALMNCVRTQEHLNMLIDGLSRNCARVIMHSSGHFVVLRFLQKWPFPHTKLIIDTLASNCAEIGSDHHGLRIMKTVLGCTEVQHLGLLFKEVTRQTMKLVENQYGNYIVQAVLDVAPKSVQTNIHVKMEGKIMRLAKQKFSSNVVERNLHMADPHWRASIIEELCSQPGVGEVLRDRYGNYCLQTALQVADVTQVDRLVRAIHPHLSTLRDNVRAKWTSILQAATDRVMATTHEGTQQQLPNGQMFFQSVRRPPQQQQRMPAHYQPHPQMRPHQMQGRHSSFPSTAAHQHPSSLPQSVRSHMSCPPRGYNRGRGSYPHMDISANSYRRQM